MSVFDEMRANRAQQADDRRADRAQAAESRRADRAAEREQNRADRQAQQERRDQRRTERQHRRRQACASAVRWVSEHPVELAMAAIIVVPALLAWTAMASYGQKIYGPIGVLLPLFTEAAMWGFAFKQHLARRAGSPTGWLQLGTWAFTAVAAVLNYVHGHAAGGASVGVVMAVVSVGGVVAHQILTAAPMRHRRTRNQRLAARRVTRMERAALRRAVGELDADGTVRLLHEPGTVTLRRAWTGRARLDRAAVVGIGADGPAASHSGADSLGAEIEQWLRETPSPDTLTGTTDPVGDAGDDLRRDRAVTPSPDAVTDEISEPPRRTLDELRGQLRQAVEAGSVDPASAESIRKTLRVGRDRAKQLRDEWNDGTGVAA